MTQLERHAVRGAQRQHHQRRDTTTQRGPGEVHLRDGKFRDETRDHRRDLVVPRLEAEAVGRRDLAAELLQIGRSRAFLTDTQATQRSAHSVDRRRHRRPHLRGGLGDRGGPQAGERAIRLQRAVRAAAEVEGGFTFRSFDLAHERSAVADRLAELILRELPVQAPSPEFGTETVTVRSVGFQILQRSSHAGEPPSITCRTPSSVRTATRSSDHLHSATQLERAPSTSGHRDAVAPAPSGRHRQGLPWPAVDTRERSC